MLAPPPDSFDYFGYCRTLEECDLPQPLRHLLGVMARTAPGGLASGKNVSVPALCARTGVSSERTMHKLLRLAGEAGWLEQISHGRGHRNSYQLLTAVAVDNSATPAEVAGGTPAEVAGVPPQDLPGTPAELAVRQSLPLLTSVPSISARVRDALRKRGGLVADDDEISAVIAHLEHRQPHPVRNVAGYLWSCPPADVRRVFTQATTATPVPDTASDLRKELQEARDNPAMECQHGTAGGLHVRSDTGSAHCSMCRTAAQRPHTRPNGPLPASLGRGGGRPTGREALSAARA